MAKTETSGGRAQVIKGVLEKMEKQMTEDGMKATMGDYIRLVQLHKELDEESPKEIKVTYFSNDGLGTNYSGMPFYDAWNLATFAALYGHAMATITVNTVDPASYPDEAAYLPTVIGNFTSSIMSFVRGTQAGCRFEVLYPTDVNQTAFNRKINFPAAGVDACGTCLFEDGGVRVHVRPESGLELGTLDFGDALGFAAAQRSHLVGCRRFDDGLAQGSSCGRGEALRKRGAVCDRSVLL